MPQIKAYGVGAPEASFAPLEIERRAPGPKDVAIDILYCGVCHSDLHTARGEWGNTLYPSVPGHEIVGRVSQVGADVTRFKAGDIVGVGCMVDSCRACASCRAGFEQYCEGPNGFTGTYNGPMIPDGSNTYGGYSKAVVVDQDFVLRVPDKLELKGVAPLLCAGITTYSPLRHWKVGPGQKVGIVGLGGLGHMGVKLAHAMGAEVWLFTTSPNKADDARRLGATGVVLSRDADDMAKHVGSFDFILDTVSAKHDITALLQLLKRDATLTQVGAPGEPLPVGVFSLIPARRRLAGSLIGGIAETQEMLDFCGQHGLTADIETIRMDEIETAYERMLKSDVKYRFVIDMESLEASA